MQVELAFDVLKDNKRCYDNILSECGISDPFRLFYAKKSYFPPKQNGSH
jgi:hypothetical protein